MQTLATLFELCLDQFSTCCGNVTHQGLTEIPQFAQVSGNGGNIYWDYLTSLQVIAI